MSYDTGLRFLAVLGLCWPSSWTSLVLVRGLSFPVAHGILVSWPSGIKPTSPVLEGRLLTTGPPGKALSFSLWLTLLSVTISRSVHIAVVWHCFILLCDWGLSSCVCVSRLHPFIPQWHSGCFHVLAVVNSVAVNIGMHVSFCIIALSSYVPRSGTAGSYGNAVFMFFEKPPYFLP